MEFLKENHRNPSKHGIEEHDMLNWNRLKVKVGLREHFDYLSNHRSGLNKEEDDIIDEIWYKSLEKTISII